MDPENQAAIRRLVDAAGAESLVVVLGAASLDLAEVAAKTVTVGDPSYAGPLAGVSLRLPVYHILEPEMKAAIPADVYEKEAGFMELIVDTSAIGEKLGNARRAAGIQN